MISPTTCQRTEAIRGIPSISTPTPGIYQVNSKYLHVSRLIAGTFFPAILYQTTMQIHFIDT
jgi:hypothetical protein